MHWRLASLAFVLDATVALSFNMLKAGKVPKMKKKSYTNVMDGVHRIVPRD